MAETASQYVQKSVFYAMSQPMVGSVIPGDLRRYNVRLVNYPDLSQEKLISGGRRKLFGSVIKPPDMNETHGSGGDVMKKMMAMLKGSGGPQLQEGYEQVKDDLSWRKHR